VHLRVDELEQRQTRNRLGEKPHRHREPSASTIGLIPVICGCEAPLLRGESRPGLCVWRRSNP
jgi:hypothetical protein